MQQTQANFTKASFNAEAAARPYSVDFKRAGADGLISHIRRETRGKVIIDIHPFVPEEAAECLKQHGLGHIVCNHFEDEIIKPNSAALIEKIVAACKTLNKEEAAAGFLNAAMDMEVNSRLFDAEGWAAFRRQALDASDKIIKAGGSAAKKQRTALGVHPADYKLPCGHSWLYYFDILVQRLLNDTDNSDDERLRQLVNGLKDGGGAGANDMSEIIKDNFNMLPKNLRQKVKGYATAYADITIQSKTYLHFFNEIKKICTTKERTRLVSDQLYYSNRKPELKVILPRRIYEPKRCFSRMIVLIDISGSMSEAILSGVLSALKDLKHIFEKTARIIQWNTNLVSDDDLYNCTPKIGGGTDMACGIEYCKKYLDKKSVFIIISDMADNLDRWLEKGSGLNAAKKTIINFESVPPLPRRFLEVFDVRRCRVLGV
ncbi:MAG: VWA domain-containing protein [Spirochaetaceae bacterium]|jgi:hypothetical protein|nr:VWA domain-containing protein [Spirochaetaceae bacterium]